ncbi:MAG: maleylpyruvate isomerase family mycothiol-dependent enzyme [Acidimicrobiales bacterium]
MSHQLDALQASVLRLRGIAERLDPAQLEQPAYPAEWTVADVLSHIGSGAVVLGRRLDDSIAGAEPDPGFGPSVWDEWNAKSPAAKRDDALAADAGLLERLNALTVEQRAAFRLVMGPLDLDFDDFVGLRLNEHAVHTWDVEVTFDPSAELAPTSVAVVIDSLEMIAGFSGRPTGTEQTVRVHTTGPDRDLTIVVGARSVSLQPGAGSGPPDLELPAEALIRLVYGRLDPDHTPAVEGGQLLDELRPVFPGV